VATTDYISAQALPANIEAERSILGAILLDNLSYNQAAEHLKAEDFLLDSHRRIYARMVDLSEASHSIDLITLCEELGRHGELEAIGGAAYISGLLDGVPDRPSIEHYIKIVRDKALLRGLIHTATAAIARASEQADPAEEILNDAEAQIFQLSEKRIGRGFMGVLEIIKESFGSADALLQRGSRITGLETHYVDLDEKTSGLQKSDLIIVAARPSMGKTSFAMNIAENVSIKMGRPSLCFPSKCRRRRCCNACCARWLGLMRISSAPARCGRTTCARFLMRSKNWGRRQFLSTTRPVSPSAKCGPSPGDCCNR